jgi:hypothetical protein
MVCYSSRAFPRTPKGHGWRHSPLDGSGSSPRAPEVLSGVEGAGIGVTAASTKKRARARQRCFGGVREDDGAGASMVWRRQGRWWRRAASSLRRAHGEARPLAWRKTRARRQWMFACVEEQSGARDSSKEYKTFCPRAHPIYSDASSLPVLTTNRQWWDTSLPINKTNRQWSVPSLLLTKTNRQWSVPSLPVLANNRNWRGKRLYK